MLISDDQSFEIAKRIVILQNITYDDWFSYDNDNLDLSNIRQFNKFHQ